MQGFKNIFNKIKSGKARHFMCIALLLCVSIVVCGFIAYEKLPVTSDKSIAQMVCDGTDGLTEIITDDGNIEQTFTLPASTPLYGVIIRADIANRVQHGTISCELLQNGKVVARAFDDLTTLIDGANKGFVFDNMHKNETDQAYTLRITIEPKTDQDAISLYKASKAPAQGFTLMQNGEPTQGCIALKFLINHTGDFIYVWFFVLAGFIIVSLVALYVMVFMVKAKIHTVFLLMALTIGIVFCFVTPQRSAPDEYVHIANAYANSSVLLGQEVRDSNGSLLVRKSDAVKDFGIYRDYSIYAWKETYDGLFTLGDSSAMVPVAARTAKVFPLMYGAQTVGITIARLLNLGYIPMLLLGRLFNLLQYVALVYMAIRIMPFAKTTLLLVAVLPMSLQLAGSFSYDAYVMGLAFLFIALCLNYAYGAKKVGVKQLAILCIIAAIFSPAKSVYILIAALCFIIPKDKITVLAKLSRKHAAWVFKGAIIACSMILWLGYNASLMQSLLNTVNVPPQLPQTQSVSQDALQQNQRVTQSATPESVATAEATPLTATLPDDATTGQLISAPSQDAITDSLKNDILENGDSKHYFTFGYILTHIPQTVKMLLNTVLQHSALYLQGLVGGRLGEIIVVNVEISWLYVIALLAIIAMSLIPQHKEKLVYKGTSRIWGHLIVAGVAGLVVLACVTWTPINYTTVFGIQGRYFLPVLPLLLLGLRSSKYITAQKPLDNGLCFASGIINTLVILNIFYIIA